MNNLKLMPRKPPSTPADPTNAHIAMILGEVATETDCDKLMDVALAVLEKACREHLRRRGL